MKLRLPALAGTVILGMVMTALAGSDSAMKIVGAWELTKSDTPSPKGLKITLEFFKDGKLQAKLEFPDKTETIKGSFTVKGEKLHAILNFGGKEEQQTFTIRKLTERELITEDGAGIKEEFKRIR